MMPSFKFTKEERLKSKILFGQLFNRDTSSSFSNYPLRIVWTPMHNERTDTPIQMALSVPKRAFNKAAHRNRIRRQIREAYRLNKHVLYEGLPEGQQYAIMLIYTAKEALAYQEIETAVQNIIKRFVKKVKVN